MNSQSNNYGRYLQYYANSSEAYNIYDKEHYVKNIPFKTKKVMRRVKKSPVYKMAAKDTSHAISPLAMITVIIVFAGLITTTVGFATNVEQQSYIRELSNELKKIRNDIQVLEFEISQSYNLREIENIASLRLGMSKPAHHQIKYIEVHKPNAVIQYNIDEQVESKNYFQRFLDILNL